MTERTPVVIEIGALREMYYTGIPNVIAEICARFLRESYWQDGKVRKRALCNLSDWPAAVAIKQGHRSSAYWCPLRAGDRGLSEIT